MASPSPDPRSGSLKPTGTRAMNEVDLQRKRARDRKAQQAMRDRNKWTLHEQHQQISFLTQALEYETGQNGRLNAKVQSLEQENESLRVQIAALRLRLLGAPEDGAAEATESNNPDGRQPWQLQPRATEPKSAADKILAMFAHETREHHKRLAMAPSTGPHEQLYRALSFCTPLDLRPLLEPDARCDDEASNVVAQAVRSYTALNTLPKRLAIHLTMSVLLRWQILQDEDSYSHIPDWLRPLPSQLATAHDPSVDRLAWPQARRYILEHPDVSAEDFVGLFFSSFDLRLEENAPSLVVEIEGSRRIQINPLFEDYIRNMDNWVIGEPFSSTYPDLARVIGKT